MGLLVGQTPVKSSAAEMMRNSYWKKIKLRIFAKI